jgi:nucleotide-binding universal stress UspA family protein
MRRIVAATDGSDVADRAVDFAADLASKFAAELVLVYVIERSAPVSSSAGGARTIPVLGTMTRTEDTSLPEALQEAAHDVLAKALARAEGRGAGHVDMELRAGEPADTLIAAAKEHEADVMVLGKSGRGRLAGLLLGSVSQKVVTNASWAVIIVP